MGADRGSLSDDRDRPNRARAETPNRQIVGLAGGGARRVGAGVSRAEVKVQDRGGQDQQANHSKRGQPHRPSPDQSGQAPAPGEPDPAPGRDASGPARGPLEHPTGRESEQGRKQSQGGGHHDQHRQRDPDGQTVEGGQVHQEQAHEGDDHRRAGQDHGPPGGGQSLRDRLLRRTVAAQGGPIAGDHQQGVVDPDADADQGGHLVGEIRSGHRTSRDANQRDGDANAGQGNQDGQAGGQHRTEHDEQHDQGGHHADDVTFRSAP